MEEPHHVQEAQDHKAHDPDDEGIHDLADDEAAEDLMNILKLLHRKLCPLYGKNRIDQLLELGKEHVLDIQKVDHDDQADDDVIEPHQHRGHSGIGLADDSGNIGQHRVVQKILQISRRVVIKHQEVLLVFGIRCKELIEGAVDPADIGRQGVDYIHDGAIQLRKHHGDDADGCGTEDDHRHQSGSELGDAPWGFPVLFPCGKLLIYKFVHMIVNGGHKVGHDGTIDHGHQDAQDQPHHCGQLLQMDKKEDHADGGGDHRKGRKPP